MDRIEWVIASCRLLRAIGDEIAGTRPFERLTIGTGIHLEPKMVALLLTLQRGGADVVATGNLNTTQQEACDYLAARGVRVVGGPTSDPAELDSFLREVVAARPDLLLDNTATCSSAGSRSRTTGCVAERRRPPQSACGSSRCATGCGCRSSSSTTARSSSSPRTGTPSARASSSRTCA